jgi:hypothetical protein
MTDQQKAAMQAAIDCLVGVAIGKYDGNAAEVSANLRAALARQEQTKPAAWIDGSGHPRHISYVQSATEKRLYGPLRPLYERTPKEVEQVLMNNGQPLFGPHTKDGGYVADRSLRVSTPPRKPLNHMEIIELWGDRSDGHDNGEIVGFARAIERAHGIGDEA